MNANIDVATRTEAPSGAQEDAARLRTYAGFAGYAWGVVGYTLFVIAFGAWVRITGSGAGCGEHWPTCHGEIIPRAPETTTLIEYTHRITSGLLGPLSLGLLVWAFLGAGRRLPVWVLALLTFVFIGIEALIGAGLVLGGLVADDASVSRAVVVALHLGNTLLLTAVAALTAWLGRGRELALSLEGAGGKLLLLLALVAVVSMTGAVTALGDTLFPVSPTDGSGMFARVREGLDVGSHFLVRLRAVHPILATALALWLLWLSNGWMQPGEQGRGGTAHGEPRRLARTLHVLVWAQLFCGMINIMLSAPGWLQLLHLLLAQGIWISLVLMFADARGLVRQPSAA